MTVTDITPDQYPTREQIDAAVSAWVANRRGNRIDLTNVDALKVRLHALFPQPTPSAEPRMTCGEPRPHDAHEGDTGFGDELDIDWVHWKCPGVPRAVLPAAPPSIADMAPGTTFWAKDGKGAWRRLSKTNASVTSVVDLTTGQHFPAIHVLLSSIRDVALPKETP